MYSNFIKTILVFILTLVAYMPIPGNATSLQEVIDTYCRKECVKADHLTSAAKRAANGYKVDYHAIMAIVHIESKYHIKAKNGSSVGLSQVLLRYHKGKFRGKNYFDVEDNLFAGMQVFRDCLTKVKGNYPKAFSCYNGGGDKNYQTKAMKALAMMRGLDYPNTTNDPLGEFLISKNITLDRSE